MLTPLWLSSKDTFSGVPCFKFAHLPLIQDIRKDASHKPHLFGNNLSKELFLLVYISIESLSSSSHKSKQASHCSCYRSSPRECLKAQGRSGCSPSSPASTPLLGEVHSLVIWSSSAFLLDSRPSISRPLMEQRPAGKHKSKMAGTVTPGTTIKSLSFRLRKFALLWEFPKLTFFFNCIT